MRTAESGCVVNLSLSHLVNQDGSSPYARNGPQRAIRIE